MRSTSIHNLNADRGMNFIQKPMYLALNFINNLCAYYDVDKRIVFKPYIDGSWRLFWDKTFASSSPGRRLSDLFWRTLPWQEMKEELGEIHVFDTGCGQGNYSLRLWDGISSYTGIDAKRRPNWAKLEAEHENIRFIESNSVDILSLIPEKTNFFITQSAIEHFDEDLKFFEQIAEFISRKGSPVIQVHNFPAKAVLPLYLFHGIRQYTPRTISKITRLFSNSQFYLYGLGGKECKKVQWKYFTWPHLFLGREPAWKNDVEAYDMEVRKAIECDAQAETNSPLFWVLIIHSNQRKKIWQA